MDLTSQDKIVLGLGITIAFLFFVNVILALCVRSQRLRRRGL